MGRRRPGLSAHPRVRCSAFAVPRDFMTLLAAGFGIGWFGFARLAVRRTENTLADEVRRI